MRSVAHGSRPPPPSGAYRADSSIWEGVTAMPFITLGLEQIIQWKYGVMGTLGVTLLSLGAKVGNPNCACAGALILALLFAPTD
jgi:hypothetical protein